MDGGQVVLRQRQPRWAHVFAAVFLTVFLVIVVTVVLAGDVRRLLSAVPTAGFALFGVGILARPPRIELHAEALVVRKLRTVRIPYADITSVRGDVPSRLDWSTHLVVDRREGRALSLPPVEASLSEVHDLVVARAGLG